MKQKNKKKKQKKNKSKHCKRSFSKKLWKEEVQSFKPREEALKLKIKNVFREYVKEKSTSQGLSFLLWSFS